MKKLDKRFWECVSRHCVAAHESSYSEQPVKWGAICADCTYVHECFADGQCTGYWPTANAVLRKKSGIGCQFARRD